MKFSISNIDIFSLSLLLSTALAAPTLEKRASPIALGLAKTFGAIAGSTLTSTGTTLITGDAGVYPGTSITGFPPGVITGITTAGGTASQNAEADCLTAYNNAKALVPTFALPAEDLGGVTLSPGVYTFPTLGATLGAGTTLTLSGAGNVNGQWIFQISTTFTVGAAAQVVLTNGAQACNVYFVLGSSASIGAGAELQGNILAGTLIAASESASGKGTWCSKDTAVTLINNALTAQTSCTSV